MDIEEMIKERLHDHIVQIAKEIKNTIEYEFAVEYGDVHIGEPTVTDDSITFDLSELSDYEKKLLNEYYYPNAKKRRAKGGG